MIVLEQILNWFVSIGARPLDLLFIAILFLVRRNDVNKIDELRAKYELLNTTVIRLCDEIYRLSGMRLLNRHRSGDSSIANPLFEHLDKRDQGE